MATFLRNISFSKSILPKHMWYILFLINPHHLINAQESALKQSDFTVDEYHVKAGDTLFSLAKSASIPLDSLLELNRANGVFIEKSSIKVGQKIYLPLKKKHVLDSQLPDISAEGPTSLVSSLGLTQDKVENFIANESARLGEKYSKDSRIQDKNGHESSQPKDKEIDYWKTQAVNEATRLVNAGANELLAGSAKKVGSAKTDIKLDQKMKVASISADLLMPLDKTESKLTFVQGGIRRNEQGKRLIANIGLGQRYFSDTGMLGYNVFYDHDLSRGHNRFGVGGEAWADYLKLNTNIYVPISDWKNSSTLANHMEKAAYGTDLKVIGYLPSYPQLGFSGKAEKYFGDKVDLLSNGKLVADPHALTLGVEYTPIPLVTVSASQMNAKGQGSSADVTLQLNWDLGKSLDEMLEPANVASSRQLKGMELDLVDRNNDIVLQYKEIDSFTIKLPDAVRVTELQRLIIDPEISGDTNGYSYEWDLALHEETIAEQPNLNRRQLVIEQAPYYDKTGTNEYLVTLKVTDRKGIAHYASTRVYIDENPSLNSYVRLKDKSVVMAINTEYGVEWSIYDPRNAECQPCGMDNMDYEVAITVGEPLRPYMKGVKIIAGSTVMEPATLKVSVLTPSGHHMEDVMTVSIVNDGSGKLTLLGIKLQNLDGTPYTDSVLRVGKVKLIPHVEFDGAIATGLLEHRFYWERKHVDGGEWELTSHNGDEYITTVNDQGYVFRLVATAET